MFVYHYTCFIYNVFTSDVNKKKNILPERNTSFDTYMYPLKRMYTQSKRVNLDEMLRWS